MTKALKAASDTEMIEYKSITEKDLPAIKEINRLCGLEEMSESFLSAFLLSKNSIFLSALDGEKIVGYIIVSFVPIDGGGEGEIIDIAVLPSYQCNGIGKSLLSQAISELEKIGITEIFLEVRPSNHSAISLYNHFGFNEYGRRKNYYSSPKEDCVLMKKELGR